MNKFKSLMFVLTLVCFSFSGGAAHAAGKAKKLRKIHKLMKLTGASAMTTQMMARFKQALPNVPASFWKKVMRKKDLAELMNGVAAVYEKHLSMRDIDGLITFFSSPVGRRFVQIQPQLLRDSMQIGQAWGQKMSRRIQAELAKMKKQKK